MKNFYKLNRPAAFVKRAEAAIKKIASMALKYRSKQPEIPPLPSGESR